MNLKQLTILSGSRDRSVVGRKMVALVKDGLVKCETYNRRNVYALTSNGLNLIDSQCKVYTVKGFSTQHNLNIVDSACYLYLFYNAALDDIKTDRNFYNMKLSHKPDLIFGRSCVEIELNAKNNTRFLSNIRRNSECFAMQFWIIPKRLKRLDKAITEYSKKLAINTKVLYIEDVIEKIESFDLSNNTYFPEDLKAKGAFG